MQTEQGLGQLEQQVYQNNANFIKGMSDNVGSAIDEGVELGANIYSGGMTGMASTLGGGGDAPKGVSNPYNKDYSMFGANKALS